MWRTTFLVSVLVVISFFHQAKAEIISSIQSGNWGETSTWDIGRLPQAGDTVIIHHEVSHSETINIDNSGLDHLFISTDGALTAYKIYNSGNIINNGVLIVEQLENRSTGTITTNSFLDAEFFINEAGAVLENFGELVVKKELKNETNAYVYNHGGIETFGELDNRGQFNHEQNAFLMVSKQFNNSGILTLCGTIVLERKLYDFINFINTGAIDGCGGSINSKAEIATFRDNGSINGTVYICMKKGTIDLVNGVADAPINNCCGTFLVDAGPDHFSCANYPEEMELGGFPTIENGTEPYSINWTEEGGSFFSGLPNPIVSPTVETKYYVTVTDSEGCTKTDSIVITPVNRILARTGGDVKAICKGDSIRLGEEPSVLCGSDDFKYAWFPSTGLNDSTSMNPIAKPTETITYYLIAIDIINEDTIVNDITVLVNDRPTPAMAGEDLQLCGEEAINLEANTPEIGFGFWLRAEGNSIVEDSFDPNSQLFLEQEDTTTLVWLTVNGVCESEDYVTIINASQPSDAFAGDDFVLCEGNAADLQASEVSNGTGSWSVVSGRAEIEDPASSSTYVSNLEENKETILKWSVSKEGCPPSEDELSIFVYGDAGVLPSDTVICDGDEVTLMAFGGSSYLWSTDVNAVLSQDNEIQVSPDVATKYVVNITREGCEDLVAESHVRVSPIPEIEAGLDTTLILGQSTQLFARSNEIVTFEWFPNLWIDDVSSSDPVVRPEEEVTYIVTVTNEVGCQNEESVHINVKEGFTIFIPEMFSPNGDGSNDVLLVNTYGVKSLSFRVFNRLGQMVFETENFEKGWDGTWNGVDQQMDTFVYTLEAEKFDGEVISKKGAIQLVR